MGKQCVDHLDNTFKSIKEMCKYHHIKQITFYNRLKKGYSLEETLTMPVDKTRCPKQCQDHLGNTFGSFRKMCKYYNVNERTTRKRLEKGYSLKEALTVPTVKISPKQCTDHLGNTFESFRKMCKYYNIDHQTVCYRLKNGDSLEKALTMSVGKINSGNSKQCTDHLGNTFKSLSDMCKYHNVDYRTVYSRLNIGWTVEEALTKTKQYQDHLGNTFKSLSDMCKYHNVNYQTIYKRLKAGYTIKEALTKKSYEQKHKQKT